MTIVMLGDFLYRHMRNHKLDMSLARKESKSCSVSWLPLKNDFIDFAKAR